MAKYFPYRQIHLDFHTHPDIPDIGGSFDPIRFVNILKDAKVNSINIFAKDHHGMCYFPTKVGTMHPGLTFDLLGTIIGACHREGIRVPVYVATGWEEKAAEHADWLEVSMDGILGGKKPFEAGHYRWKKLCHNKEGYIRHILAFTDELIGNYDIDGFWYDIVFQNECVCGDCLASMKEAGLDPQNPSDVRKNGFKVIERFMERIQSHVLNRLPEASVYFNMHIDPDGGYDPEFSIRNKNRFQTHIEIESLPSGEWGYNHFPLYVNYLNTFSKAAIGMNGRFHKSWGDFGTLKNREALEYECFRMIANGCRCSIGDHLHPSGALDEAVYNRIGGVYSRVEALEPWLTGGEKVREVGVLMANRPLELNYASDEGVMRMLLELHVPFDFIDFRHDFSRYKLLILPDRVTFGDETIVKLKQFIDGGGKIIATHLSGMKEDGSGAILPEFGILGTSANPYEPSYVRLLPAEIEGVEPFTYVFYKRGLLVKTADSVKKYGAVFPSYFNRSWDRFCGHCQTPPDYREDMKSPALVEGKGILYCSYPLFSDYAENGVRFYRDLFQWMLLKSAVKPLIGGNLPTTAEVNLWRQEKENRLILHILHYIPQRKSACLDVLDAVIPLTDCHVILRTDSAPKRAYMAPSGKDLKYTWEPASKTTRIEIDRIEGYAVVAIEQS